MSEPKVLTRMRLCECWGDSLNAEELKEVNGFLENLEQENQKYKETIDKTKEAIEGNIDGYSSINEFGTYNETLEMLNDLLNILKEVEDK